ncbi:MAG: hypothetical protein IJ349_10900 [Clostridia bacterium]|nr:hypothetical protein [Clostridia bacterium]
MKKTLRSILIFFIVTAVLAGGIFAYTTVESRTLKNTMKSYSIEVFVPSGMANEYEDLLAMTFDDHRIWKYRLTDTEAAQITENLKNGIWKKLPDDVGKELEWYLPDGYSPEVSGGELYFCAYSTQDEKFDYNLSGPEMPPRFLFLYDTENQIYYCVSKEI